MLHVPSLAKGMILAHRGYWADGNQPNSLAAISEALKRGYGVETDVRDIGNKLVIAHDVDDEEALPVAEILPLLHEQEGILAINIKSDGLLPLLRELDPVLQNVDHFFFDMSVPEMVRYFKAGAPVASRRSEHEAASADWSEAKTIWLDAFHSEWWMGLSWPEVATNNQRVFVVSPELHGRPHLDAWQKVRAWLGEGHPVGLCTDLPDQAYNYLTTGDLP